MHGSSDLIIFLLTCTQGVPDGVVVTQFHYTGWPEHGKPSSTATVLKIIDALIKTQMTSGNNAITVMCK